MHFLVILAFLGQTTGETFFYRYENENFTLTCNETLANGSNETVWYEIREHLQVFNAITCSPISQGTNEQPYNRKRTNRLSVSTSRSGGVFACEQLTNTGTLGTLPLFTNVAHCRRYNFFIVVIINMTAESQMFENISAKSYDNRLVQEGGNITLSCEFQTKSNGINVAYWIKYTETSKCLSSLQKGTELSYNHHCCIDEMIKGRLLNHTSLDSDNKHIVHNITILNVTYSDSGTYLCVVNAWSKGKYVWKIANNLSIEVRNEIPFSPSVPFHSKVPLYATIGSIAGIITISGIVWLIYKKKKNNNSKGKSSAQLPSAQAAVEIPGDECFPYAMSSRKDLKRNEVLYSVAASPYENPNADYCIVDDTEASGKRPGDKIHTVYALVQE
nr:uncharacterized protein LOC102455376 isoform X1 [Pelodiscus sinensis]XP_025038324.1 uncharacterized protein LOC102455376 isoform X1 [Pelodiscus sinensis]|eukprot:XP_006118967.2 uncharacterized protein LOC102455376 isoform X1 [Pelodiscus sinensis]